MRGKFLGASALAVAIALSAPAGASTVGQRVALFAKHHKYLGPFLDEFCTGWGCPGNVGTNLGTNPIGRVYFGLTYSEVADTASASDTNPLVIDTTTPVPGLKGVSGSASNQIYVQTTIPAFTSASAPFWTEDGLNPNATAATVNELAYFLKQSSAGADSYDHVNPVAGGALGAAGSLSLDFTHLATAATAGTAFTNGLALNTQQVGGDSIGSAYYYSGGNMYGEVYLNGKLVVPAVNITAQEDPSLLGTGMGIRTNLSTTFRNHSFSKLTDTGSQADIRLSVPWHIQPTDLAGNTTFKLPFDYSGACPTLKLDAIYVSGVNAGQGVAGVTGLVPASVTCGPPLTPSSAGRGLATFAQKPAGTISTGTLFRLKLSRTDITSPGVAFDYSPVMQLGMVGVICNGQSLCVNGEADHSSNSFAQPANSNLYTTDGSYYPNGTLGIVQYSYKARDVTAWMGTGSGAFYSRRTFLSTLFNSGATPAAINGIATGIGGTTYFGRCPSGGCGVANNASATSTSPTSTVLTISGDTGTIQPGATVYNSSGLQVGVLAQAYGAYSTTGTGGNGTYSYTLDSGATAPSGAVSFNTNGDFSSMMAAIGETGGYISFLNDIGGSYDAAYSSGNGSTADIKGNLTFTYQALDTALGYSPPIIVTPLEAIVSVSDTGINSVRASQWSVTQTGTQFSFGQNMADLQNNTTDPYHYDGIGFQVEFGREALSDLDRLYGGTAYKRGIFLTGPSTSSHTDHSVTLGYYAPNATSLTINNTVALNGFDQGMHFGAASGAIGTGSEVHANAIPTCTAPDGTFHGTCTFLFATNTFLGSAYVAGPIGHEPFNSNDDPTIRSAGHNHVDYWMDAAAILRARYDGAVFTGSVSGTALTYTSGNAPTIGQWCAVLGTSTVEQQILSGTSPNFTLSGSNLPTVTGVTINCGEAGQPVQFYFDPTHSDGSVNYMVIP